MKTVTIELVVRTQVPDDTDLTHLSVSRSGVVIPLIEGKPVIVGDKVVGYPTHPVEHEHHLTHQWRITEGDYALADEPTPMAKHIVNEDGLGYEDSTNKSAEFAEFFRETWPAFQRGDIDVNAVKTEMFRMGWPKPTIYREHEAIHILANALDKALERKPEAKDLHNDDWMMERISKALDAIRHAEYAGLETELDLIAFAEDVLDHYRPKEAP